jgi:tRNA threonylcarbamoyl adenosine modification protein (Sua5/YciO/YrdC/YwlC family)
MLIRIHPDNPSQRQIRQVVDLLQSGGVIIYPTDTLYGIGCDITNQKAIERIARIKGVNAQKANFSFICYDLSHLSDYTLPVSNDIFKLMKRNLPGPFTFILPASSMVPKLLKSKRKTVGIRVPDNGIVQNIVNELGNPVLSTSVFEDGIEVEYITDPELIHERYGDQVDMVIDGGYGNLVASAIVDCTTGDIEIVREGERELE